VIKARGKGKIKGTRSKRGGLGDDFKRAPISQGEGERGKVYDKDK